MEQYSSHLLEKAVNELAKLPGIGRRSALRLAVHILRNEKNDALALGNSIIDLRSNIKFCKKCFNISDNDLCEICSNPKRDLQTICVLADIRDVLAIEKTSQFKGVYHVLGGLISPMEGVGPQELNIDGLISRLQNDDIREVLLALPSTVEGDTTAFFLYKKIKPFLENVTSIARGISVGDELEYADEVTLGRSILNRQPYKND
jgi:recombination protein RecR